MPLSSAFASYCTRFLVSYIFVFVSIQHPFFNIFEGSPSYVQTHSSCGESPTLWKKHIQLLISAHSLHYHGHMNMTTCSHTSLYTHNRSMQACRLGGGGGFGGFGRTARTQAKVRRPCHSAFSAHCSWSSY